MARDIKPGTPEYKKLMEMRHQADMEGLKAMNVKGPNYKKPADKKAPAKKKK